MEQKSLNQHSSRMVNLELCRIFCMVLIILNHYSGYGIGNDFAVPAEGVYTLTRVFIRALNVGGKLGVNVFVLISGYFLVNSKFNVKKIIKLWLQVFFYSLGSFAFAVVGGVTSFSLKELIYALLPVTFNQYWFFTTYFYLYLLFPFINLVVNNIGREAHRNCLIVATVVFYVLPTLTLRDNIGSNLIWFIYLYILAAYIRKYGIKMPNTTLKRFICMALSIFALQISIIAIDSSTLLYNIFEDILYFRNMNTITGLICSLFIFVFFLNWNIQTNHKVNKCILSLSAISFGTYLLHMNHNTYLFIIRDVFQSSEFNGSWMLPIHAAVYVIAIFIGTFFIEKIRVVVTEKPILRLLDIADKKISIYSTINNFFNRK